MILVHLWNHRTHTHHTPPSSISAWDLGHSDILRSPKNFQKVFVLGKWDFTWIQSQHPSTKHVCYWSMQSLPIEVCSFQGSDHLLEHCEYSQLLRLHSSQTLQLIWQTMLPHLGDKYGKDILAFWQALSFYVPIFFCQGFQYHNKCQPIPYF